VAIVFGLVVMVCASPEEEFIEKPWWRGIWEMIVPPPRKHDTPRTLEAFGLAAAAMVGFGLSVIAIRASCRGGLAPWSGFIVRQLVTLVFGTCALIANNRHGWPEEDNWTVAPAAAGLCLAFGVLCVNLALRSPGAGVASAIFSSNSVLVLLLNATIVGLVPGFAHLASMLIVVGGVAALALSGRESTTSPPGSPLTLSLVSADLACAVLDSTTLPHLLRSCSSPSLSGTALSGTELPLVSTELWSNRSDSDLVRLSERQSKENFFRISKEFPNVSFVMTVDENAKPACTNACTNA
jgi:drug/metabolite transporter (DMT)-like permease